MAGWRSRSGRGPDCTSLDTRSRMHAGTLASAPPPGECPAPAARIYQRPNPCPVRKPSVGEHVVVTGQIHRSRTVFERFVRQTRRIFLSWLWYQYRVNRTGSDGGHLGWPEAAGSPDASAVVMSMLTAGVPSPAYVEAGERPSSAVREGAAAVSARPRAPGRGPGSGGSDGERRPSLTAQPDVARYLGVLLARFAAHGRTHDPGRCRCGYPCPCAEEHHVARLLELAGDASQ
jgi:hypothetical protein